MSKKQKIKKKQTQNQESPRFEFIIYEEKLDPRCKEFKEVVEKASLICNSSLVNSDEYDNSNLKIITNELYTYIPESIPNYRGKKQSIEQFLSALIYYAIDKNKYDDYIKNCIFFVEHHSRLIFKIKVSSMRRLVCLDGIAYFPQSQITFKYEGEDFDLGFSKHALDRCYDRLVSNGIWHEVHHLFFQFICRDLHVERAYVTDSSDSKKKKISAALYRPLFPEFEFDNNAIESILTDEIIDHKKYQYYLKVGYAPLVFDRSRKTAKASTVLFAGMVTTPEQKVFTDQDRSKYNEDLHRLSRSFKSINNKNFKYDKGSYFWKQCVIHGFDLIIKKERCGKVYRGQTFDPSLINAREMDTDEQMLRQ